MRSIVFAIASSVLSFSAAFAESVEPSEGNRLTLCFYEARVQVDNEADYERLLDISKWIENEHYHARLLLQPLGESMSIFFADLCDSEMAYVDERNRKYLRESSVSAYQKALALKMERIRNSE